jgi:hypothetical protein
VAGHEGQKGTITSDLVGDLGLLESSGQSLKTTDLEGWSISRKDLLKNFEAWPIRLLKATVNIPLSNATMEKIQCPRLDPVRDARCNGATFGWKAEHAGQSFPLETIARN